MTKSKKNFAIIMALAILLALFGSLFAIFGMQKPQIVVEAATETREPGLYNGSNFTSWANLVSSGKISVDGEHLQVNEDLEGDLVCGPVNGLTSLRSAFSGCSKLTSIDCRQLDTRNVTDMYNTFSNCSSITSLDLSSFNTSSVTDMVRMFQECSSLISLDVSNFDTSKVTDMCEMFSDCSKLTSLDVSGWDTSKVTNMGEMFYGCSSLNTLDMSNFDTSNVTIMNSMFFDCSSLNTLDISNFNTSKVVDMSFMFAGCSFKTLNLRGKFVIPSDCMVDMMFTNLDAGIEFVCNMFKITLSEEQVNTVKGLPTPVSRAMKLANIALGKEVEPDELSNMIGKEIYDMFIIFLNDTTICEITLPTTVGTDVTLAPATGMFYAYTASDGDAQTTLPASSDGKTKLTLYKKVGETAEPVPFPSGQDTPSTGVVADLSMLVIAVASILSLAIIATKKKRVAR